METKIAEPQGPIVNALDTLDDNINALKQRVNSLSLKTEQICAEPQVTDGASLAQNHEHTHDTSSVMQQRIKRMNDDLQHAIGMLNVIYDTLEV